MIFWILNLQPKESFHTPLCSSIILYSLLIYIHLFNHEFNYLDVTLILISCFACMFVVMGGLRIPEDLEKSEEYRKQGLTHYLWWERIDQSLTPAVIITLLIMPGLILSCHFNSLN